MCGSAKSPGVRENTAVRTRSPDCTVRYSSAIVYATAVNLIRCQSVMSCRKSWVCCSTSWRKPGPSSCNKRIEYRALRMHSVLNIKLKVVELLELLIRVIESPTSLYLDRFLDHRYSNATALAEPCKSEAQNLQRIEKCDHPCQALLCLLCTVCHTRVLAPRGESPTFDVTKYAFIAD